MDTIEDVTLSDRSQRLIIGIICILLIIGIGGVIFVSLQDEPDPIKGMERPDPLEIPEERSITLTAEEEAYLEALGPVTMGVDPDWVPYEWVTEDGEFIGIAADLVYLIAERSGVTLELVLTEDWVETLERSKAGDFMMIAFLTQTPAREEWLIFTDPYFTDPAVFVTRQERDYIADPARLTGEVMVLPEGTAVEERIRRDYPNIEIITVQDEDDVFRMIEDGEADMTLRSLTMAAYTIRRHGLFNLKIAGDIPGYSQDFRMGIAKDETMLRDILNRGIATITPEEVDSIVNRHVAITIETPSDYTRFFQVIIILGVLAAIAFLWNYQLRKLNRRLAEQKEAMMRANRQLEEHETFLQTLLQTIPIPVYYKDMEGRYIGFNKAFEQFFGKSGDQIIRRSAHDLVPRDIALIAEEQDMLVLQGRGQQVFESEITGADGLPHTIIGYKTSLTDSEENIIGLIGAMLDITERKKTEDALTLANRKLQIMSGITRHDILNQIMALQGFLLFVTEEITDPGQARYLGEVKKAADAIQHQIEFTRQYEELGVKKPAWHPIPDLIDSIPSTSLPLTVDCSTYEVLADPMVRKVFANLMDNTTRHGEGATAIRLSCEEQNGELRIVWEDDGIGIQDDQKERIFDRGVGRNTGFGLFLSREILSLTGIEIRETGVHGEGARFEMIVPEGAWRKGSGT